MATIDLLLKSSGPVANQFRVLAGHLVAGHIRLSEIGAADNTLALDFVPRGCTRVAARLPTATRLPEKLP